MAKTDSSRDLGRWSRPIGAIAVAWVAFMVVMLLFPYSQTVGPQTTSESTSTSFPQVTLKSWEITLL